MSSTPGATADTNPESMAPIKLSVLSQTATMLALGFFPIVAQTLLFRVFLGAFESGELAVGCFFGSWLLWVALGAALARIETRWRARLMGSFAWLPLLYIPAYLLQDRLIVCARIIAGVQSYEVLPLGSMVGLSLIVNAPVCFLTGYLFALACSWLATGGGLPVARAYVLETLGGFLGGVSVTVLLANAVPAQVVFLVAASTAAISVALHRPRSWRYVAPAAILIVLTASGAGIRWAEGERRATWKRLLPSEAYVGGFATAQGEYLYGEREGQFLAVTCGGVRESLPDTDHVSTVAAVNLAQNPSSSRVLVIGPGSLALCLRLTAFPNIHRTVWIDPDPELAGRLLSLLPIRYSRDAEKLETPKHDAAAFLRENPGAFDLVVLNLPEPTSLVVNRYATREFLFDVKSSLADGGVVSARVTGGANYVGSELAFLGASLRKTLGSVYHNVVIKPGEETWLIASDASGLTEAPAVLRDRFASIAGVAALYPPEGLLSQYVPDRAAYQARIYGDVESTVPERLLLNVASRPKALLYGLMLARRRGGEQAAPFQTPLLLESGFWIAVIALAVLVAVRTVYVLKSSRVSRGAPPWPFDAGFLVFSTGLAGMSLSVILMLLYQSAFGTLYLHVGLITSLFMLGSFAGSFIGERLLASRNSEPSALLPTCVFLHLAAIGAVGMLTTASPKAAFGVLFVIAGAFTGIYFPIAAKRLALADRKPTPAGSFLEALDTLGGAAGAACAGLVLAPVLGTRDTLVLLAIVVVANTAELLTRRRIPASSRSADFFKRTSRVAGYAMFGAGVIFLAASHIAAHAVAVAEGPRLAAAARALAGRSEPEPTEARLADGKEVLYYQVPSSPEDEGGYVFSTSHFSSKIQGYGGPIELVVYVNQDGILRDFEFFRSSETPAYVARLRQWRDGLNGANLFEPSPFAHVDAVSGATLTSAAILKTLEESGRRFAAEILRREVAPVVPAFARSTRDWGFISLAGLAVLATLLRFRPSRPLRRVVLALTVIVLGWQLNIQYSMQHTIALLDLNWPAAAITAPFALVVLIPLFAAFFGNVYCGSLCPFGALQELVGDICPVKWGRNPDNVVWRYGRFVKYVLLFLVIALYARYRDASVLSADPLITLFGPARSDSALVLFGGVLVACVFYRRFWCRNLCPAGAFLALVGGLNLLKRFLPHVRPVKCDMGVRKAAELDCLRCDRCRNA
ncbi:MAG: 4Fe-4S binding protein [Candidatus Hydrogenedentes bacterium]|nr:4Fe-4S binding protein [Candidatus Hydrogenedentota bacterium]